MGAPYTTGFDLRVQDAMDATRLFTTATRRRVRLFLAAMIVAGLVVSIVVHPSWGFALIGGAAAVLTLLETAVLDRWLIQRQGRAVFGKRSTFTLSAAARAEIVAFARGQLAASRSTAGVTG